MVVVRQGSSAALAVIAPADASGDETFDYQHNRYVSISDGYRAQRDAWMAETFPQTPVFVFSDDDTRALSRYPDGYGVLIVGGNDVSRMGRFLKANKAAISGVVKVCLMCGANAQKRAMALHAGFDDVFDVEKIHGAEAAARIEAMRRRYLSAIETDNAKARTDRVLGEYVNVERLTERERAIVEAMIGDKNRFVSYPKIQQLCSDFHNQISFENVKVIVCNLRKKLRSGVRIVAQPHKGYVLVR